MPHRQPQAKTTALIHEVHEERPPEVPRPAKPRARRSHHREQRAHRGESIRQGSASPRHSKGGAGPDSRFFSESVGCCAGRRWVGGFGLRKPKSLSVALCLCVRQTTLPPPAGLTVLRGSWLHLSYSTRLSDTHQSTETLGEEPGVLIFWRRGYL